ncbi:MAG: flagellar hook capping FlgD N-terminal domain-containing protein [Phycisphaerales bacterium]|nr:flagellar hook capping FlgD N-terminal domain-containing protein [Phycisphaerales bacterium]
MSAINNFSPTSSPSTSTDAFSALSSGEFLQIIFTELSNQDPLAPNDTQSMLNQLSTLRSIESDSQMVNSLQRMVSQSELASASQLIGSLVSGITLDNRRVSDLVISVSMTQDGPVLNMFDGSRMFFSNVDEIVGPIDDFVDPPEDDIEDDIDDDDIDDGPSDSNDDDLLIGIGQIDPTKTDGGKVDKVDTDPVRKTFSNDV